MSQVAALSDQNGNGNGKPQPAVLPLDAAETGSQSDTPFDDASVPAGRAPTIDTDAAGVTIEIRDGAESELWDPADYEAGPLAPSFSEGGGGLTFPEYEGVKSTMPVSMVPVNPYLKRAPPSNLPLESFDLRVIFEAGRTGFEDVKEFPITPGTVIAGRYQIVEHLGSATFSRAVQCLDLKHKVPVCVKVIRNSKDMLDQAMDEIKLLQLINANADPDEKHVLQLFDYFYYKEHVFLVCELLRDNLYDFYKFNREREEEAYFTLPRVQSVAKQVLTALEYIHSLNLLHCDLKPENILVKSYTRCEIKVIDFGNSCFTTDNLSSYVQSRCYRAPEVILGCGYDGRVDIWSTGCILAELLTGHVLFANTSVAQMMARISAILGPFPPAMLHEGRHTSHFFTKHGVIYERATDDDWERLLFYFPQRKSLKDICGSDDADFVDFLQQCLTLDHKKRPTATQLLAHAFLSKQLTPAAAPPAAA